MNLKEILLQLNEKIDKGIVLKACMNAAEDIFGKADKEKCARTVKAAIKKGKDTQDCIQIAINMMRGK